MYILEKFSFCFPQKKDKPGWNDMRVSKWAFIIQHVNAGLSLSVRLRPLALMRVCFVFRDVIQKKRHGTEERARVRAELNVKSVFAALEDLDWMCHIEH